MRDWRSGHGVMWQMRDESGFNRTSAERVVIITCEMSTEDGECRGAKVGKWFVIHCPDLF